MFSRAFVMAARRGRELPMLSPWLRASSMSAVASSRSSPRLAAWDGDPQCVYSYSGLRNEPLPWGKPLKQAILQFDRCLFLNVELRQSFGHQSCRESEGAHHMPVLVVEFQVKACASTLAGKLDANEAMAGL
jgi:hypothetical protein